jgi:hypothetical protein
VGIGIPEEHASLARVGSAGPGPLVPLRVFGLGLREAPLGPAASRGFRWELAGEQNLIRFRIDRLDRDGRRGTSHTFAIEAQRALPQIPARDTRGTSATLRLRRISRHSCLHDPRCRPAEAGHVRYVQVHTSCDAAMASHHAVLLLRCVRATSVSTETTSDHGLLGVHDKLTGLAFGGDRLALLELSVEDSAYGQSYAQCASRTA